MIHPNEYYRSLYERAKSQSASSNVNNFKNQEYADIIMWFNLVWFDPMWFEEMPELKAFKKQEKNFSLEQRVFLLNIQRDIIKKIIPTYKEFQDNGQIEITTTPYYHPIMPLLIDTESAKIARPEMRMPDLKFSHPEDAKIQLTRAKKIRRTIRPTIKRALAIRAISQPRRHRINRRCRNKMGHLRRRSPCLKPG
jgi:alpha-amylase/alpha-mannosidase (GH57 family)